MPKIKIGWFSTGRDETARQLLAVVQGAIREGGIAGEISFVFCNRGPGESEESDLFLGLVGKYSLPLKYFSSKNFRSPNGSERLSQQWRLEYDKEVIKLLAGFRTDICVLAGYMLIVSSEMCWRYRMINLHPAAPGGPTGSWQEVIRQLIKTRARESGVMMHLVAPELDKGPVVTYCTFPIGGKNFEEIRRQGLIREPLLIVTTLKNISQNLALAEKNGKNLTAEIDVAIGAR